MAARSGVDWDSNDTLDHALLYYPLNSDAGSAFVHGTDRPRSNRSHLLDGVSARRFSETGDMAHRIWITDGRGDAPEWACNWDWPVDRDQKCHQYG